jgi:hypothetical protein
MWLRDPRGFPSPWVALVMAIMFGGGAVVVAVLGKGYPVTAVLGFMFATCFGAAFGRPPVAVQVARALRQQRK